jgi:signal transduction histidine kinase/DNA-binding response OmpR family regulator
MQYNYEFIKPKINFLLIKIAQNLFYYQLWKQISCATIILIFFYPSVWSQENHQIVKPFSDTKEHGLPSRSVISMTQDANGFLWFSNHDAIFRFNGIEFVSFKSADLIGTDMDCVQLFSDVIGNVWLGKSCNKDNFNYLIFNSKLLKWQKFEEVFAGICPFKSKDIIWIKQSPNQKNIISIVLQDSSVYIFDGKFEKKTQISTADNVQSAVAEPFYSSYAFVFSLYGVLITLLVYWDKRKRTKVQQERTILESQVALRAQTISDQADRLKALSDKRNHFFSNLIHEFRTPISLVLAPIEQLLVKTEDQEQRITLTIAHRNAKRVLSLTNQLLDIAKLETNQLPVHPQVGNIVLFTEALINGYRTTAEEKGISLFFEANLNTQIMVFDHNIVENIFGNLLSNAIKYNNIGGKVWITLSQINHDNFRFVVKDNGIGIAEEDLPRVFDHYYRSKTAIASEIEGMGIGLALVQDMVHLQGGMVNLESRLGEGSTFTVCLPTLLLHNDTLSDAVSASDKVTLSAKMQPWSLLIVDDHADMRQFLRQMLQKEYTILEAQNGAVALIIAQQNIPDLIVTDIMMPELDGNALIRALRDDSRTSHIPIVVLTGNTNLENRLLGIESGTDAWLSKPFNPVELELRIRKLLEIRQNLQTKWSPLALSIEPETTSILSVTEQQFVHDIHDIIKHNINLAELNGDFVGKKMAMSRMNLHRKLKALTGIGISDHIRILRLDKANALLQLGELSVSEVAYQTGFSSPSHFSTLFKNHFGYSPSAISGQ